MHEGVLVIAERVEVVSWGKGSKVGESRVGW